MVTLIGLAFPFFSYFLLLLANDTTMTKEPPAAVFIVCAISSALY